MNKDSKIYLAGHTGLVGSALHRGLERHGFTNILTRDHPGLNLVNQADTEAFFKTERPEYVMLAAARVGGILANNIYRADFIYDNIQIQSNVIHFSWKYGVKKLLFLGSSCIYPRNAPQPLREDYLLTSELEYTNEPYAIAKIAGIKMCESYNIQHDCNFISVMPTNLFGPGDNYDLKKSHVLPALIRKFHLGVCLEREDMDGLRVDLNRRPVEGVGGEATRQEILKMLARYGIFSKGRSGSGIYPKPGAGRVTVTLWGTGRPMREFLYSDDLADACIYLMNEVDFSDMISKEARSYGKIRNAHLNIGTGRDHTIADLAGIISDLVGFKGRIEWDNNKPDGTYRKQMDVTRINALGWEASTSLKEGIRRVYEIYQK